MESERSHAVPPLAHSTHARTCTRTLTHTHTHERARTRGPTIHIGSAAPGRPSQLKRRLLTGAPLAHASITRRARAADAFGARRRQVRVAAEGRRIASAIVTLARRRSAWTIRVSTVKKRFAQLMKAKLPKLPRSSHGPRFRPTTADKSNPKDAAACKPTRNQPNLGSKQAWFAHWHRSVCWFFAPGPGSSWPSPARIARLAPSSSRSCQWPDCSHSA